MTEEMHKIVNFYIEKNIIKNVEPYKLIIKKMCQIDDYIISINNENIIFYICSCEYCVDQYKINCLLLKDLLNNLPFFFKPSNEYMLNNGWAVYKSKIDYDIIHKYILEKDFLSAKLYFVTNKLNEISKMFNAYELFNKTSENYFYFYKYLFTNVHYQKIYSYMSEIKNIDIFDDNLEDLLENFFQEYKLINSSDTIQNILNKFNNNLEEQNKYLFEQSNLESDLLYNELEKIFKYKYDIVNIIPIYININIDIRCCYNHVYFVHDNYLMTSYNDFIEDIYNKCFRDKKCCDNIIKLFFENISFNN